MCLGSNVRFIYFRSLTSPSMLHVLSGDCCYCFCCCCCWTRALAGSSSGNGKKGVCHKMDWDPGLCASQMLNYSLQFTQEEFAGEEIRVSSSQAPCHLIRSLLAGASDQQPVDGLCPRAAMNVAQPKTIMKAFEILGELFLPIIFGNGIAWFLSVNFGDGSILPKR